MDIGGKTAIVTGASRGIGPYIAKSLAKQGVNLIAVARSESGLKETQIDIENGGGVCHIHPYDLTEINALQGLIHDLWSLYGPIHVLVNNAGIEQYQFFDQIEKDEISSILKTNLRCPMELTRSILPKMIEQKDGHIVNIASLAGKKGLAYNSVYSASKAAVIMWSDGLRQEYWDSPIDISVICPGFISEAGMFYDGQIPPPPLLGASKPQKVADAVLKALKKGSCEIIVNQGPIRPLLAIGQLSWRIADMLTRWFGVPALNRKRISV
ncbi:MAG: SDR family NAD(P)-dependent oxidoreductase [Candidatus Marinimicrobia bacterium]|nr:SDR family NAD(P)-dependent oxidoreductase [Candidatus Neomarinimicrobiota bacterium]MDP6611630.1 SDR family NAD(P)-dependent oxidoreductase [Candidatus Neomarinimicrobiota bacterium]